MAKILYQFSVYHDDGTNIGWSTPCELKGCSYFTCVENLEEWAEDNGYDTGNLVINEVEVNEDEDCYEIVC